MRFKTIAFAAYFSLLAGIIVVPAGSSVNQDVALHIRTRVQLADGMPLPLPPRTTLVADGMPLPLPPRITGNETTLVADGMPLPLPPRTTLVADGMPLPLPPRITGNETTLVADGMPLPLPPRIGSETTLDA